jgi:hypothetical protein
MAFGPDALPPPPEPRARFDLPEALKAAVV